MVSNNMTEMSSEDVGQWLEGSRVLDLDDHKSRERAMRIKQLASRASQKAVFIQDFAKSFLFRYVSAFDQVPAAAVLRAGRGDCDTKNFSLLTFLHLARPHAICESRKFSTPEPA